MLPGALCMWLGGTGTSFISGISTWVSLSIAEGETDSSSWISQDKPLSSFCKMVQTKKAQ